MTYNSLGLEQFKLTAEEYKPFINAIAKGYKDFISESKKTLSLAYSTHLAGIKPENYYLEMVKHDRIGKLLSSMESQLNETYKATYKSLVNGGKLNVTNMYWRNLFTAEWSGVILKPLINPNVVEAAVTGSIKTWKKIKDSNKYKSLLPSYGTLSSLLDKNRVQDIEKVREVLTSSLIRGQSFVNTAKDIQKVYDTSFSNSMRIARTEGIRNLNAGAYYQGIEAEAQGLEMFKIWDATLDSSTRETHANADRQKVKVDEDFIVGSASGLYPGSLSEVGENVNCRCSSINVPDGIEPEQRRARDPVKEMQWNNASATERKNKQLSDGTKIYPRSQQTDIISNTSFNDWAKMNNLSYNKNGMLVNN